jgi:hypothetical protein
MSHVIWPNIVRSVSHFLNILRTSLGQIHVPHLNFKASGEFTSKVIRRLFVGYGRLIWLKKVAKAPRASGRSTPSFIGSSASTTHLSTTCGLTQYLTLESICLFI